MEDPKTGVKEGSDSPEIMQVKRAIQNAYEKKLYLGKGSLSINRIKDKLFNKLMFNDFRDLGFDNEEEFMEFLENEDEYDSQNTAFYYITQFLEETTDALLDPDIRETALKYLHSEIHTIEGEEEWKDEKEPLYDFYLSTNDPDGRMIAFENIKPRAMSDIKYEEEKMIEVFDNEYHLDELIEDIRDKIPIKISTEKIVEIAEEFIMVLRGRIENAFEDIRMDIYLDFQVFMEAYYNIDNRIHKVSYSRRLLRNYVLHQNKKYKEKEEMEKNILIAEVRMKWLLTYLNDIREAERYGKKEIGLHSLPVEIIFYMTDFMPIDNKTYFELLLFEAFEDFSVRKSLSRSPKSAYFYFPLILKRRIANELQELEMKTNEFLSLQLSERKEKLNSLTTFIKTKIFFLNAQLKENREEMDKLSFFKRYKYMKAFIKYLTEFKNKATKNLMDSEEEPKYLSPSERRMIEAFAILSAFDKNELWRPLMKMKKRNVGMLEAAIEEVEAQRIAVEKSVSPSIEMTPKEGKRRKFIKARLQYNFFKPSSYSSSIIIKKKKKKRQGKQRLNKEVDQYW